MIRPRPPSAPFDVRYRDVWPAELTGRTIYQVERVDAGIAPTPAIVTIEPYSGGGW